jgi:cation diffusion facilitator family transporter
MIASASANFAVATHLSSVARKSDSPALAADAKHLMVDVWTSMGVLAGLVATKLTGYNRIDAIIGFAVSLMVLNAAWHIGRGAVDFLLDGRLPDDEIVRIEHIFNVDERVLGFHKLRTRKSGADRHVDVHIQVDDDLSLRAAHQITEELEDEIRKVLPNTEVVIHTEPFHEEQIHQMEIEHRRGREGGIGKSKQ